MSFLWNWLWNRLFDWGLAQKSGKIVLLGLDNAGKTTLMHILRDDIVVAHMPTQKPTMESFTLGNLTFNMFDLGGHTIARRQWNEYCTDVSGIVYVVDVSDRERLAESREALDALTQDEQTKKVPILILGNKIDTLGACSEDELRQAFGLFQTIGKNTTSAPPGLQPVELFMCAIIKRQGFKEGFQWLSHFI